MNEWHDREGRFIPIAWTVSEFWESVPPTPAPEPEAGN